MNELNELLCFRQMNESERLALPQEKEKPTTRILHGRKCLVDGSKPKVLRAAHMDNHHVHTLLVPGPGDVVTAKQDHRRKSPGPCHGPCLRMHRLPLSAKWRNLLRSRPLTRE